MPPEKQKAEKGKETRERGKGVFVPGDKGLPMDREERGERHIGEGGCPKLVSYILRYESQTFLCLD